MSYFEVNLQLEVFSRVNSDAAIARRKATALACLRRNGPTEYRVNKGSYLGHPRIRLIARVQADVWNEAELYSLAVKIHQDCVSVFDESTGVGKLIGPRTEKWAPFKMDRFNRFDWEAEEAKRLAAIAARPEPTPEILREYALKVFTIDELRALDFRPRNHFFDMLYRRFKEYDHPPTDAEVEGIKELATEHCWNAAFG